MYGAIIAIGCCYKGMTVSGGAEGVGRTVTEEVHLFARSISRVQHPLPWRDLRSRDSPRDRNLRSEADPSGSMRNVAR